MVFIYAYIILLYTFFYYTMARSSYSDGYTGDDNFRQVMIGILILLSLPAALYNLLCETFLNGQSFGKKIMKIKVVKLDGTQPNFGTYLVRSMFRLIDRPLISIVTIAVSKRSQRFGDMVAGTTVIQMNAQVTLRDTILHRQPTDHKITYHQVSMMTDKDIHIVREVLAFGREQEQPEHIRLLAEKIRKKYGISENKQKDEDFLQTILMDYSHYQFEK